MVIDKNHVECHSNQTTAMNDHGQLCCHIRKHGIHVVAKLQFKQSLRLHVNGLNYSLYSEEYSRIKNLICDVVRCRYDLLRSPLQLKLIQTVC